MNFLKKNKSRRRTLLKINSKYLLLLCFFFSFSLVAQNTKRITGIVTIKDGVPLLGATIIVVGTDTGTLSDFDGHFSIDAAKGSVIEFSYLGMKTKRVEVGEQQELSIILEEESGNLDEVVIVAYGSSKRADLTGSISSISQEEIANSGSVNIEEALIGRAAGVVINSSDNGPGAGMNIQIRGASSLNASSAPLYVIDGFPVEGSFNDGGQGESVAQSPLSGINPNDIESINILKDASATAIYGARGANGVVIITTKSGKNGMIKVDVNAVFGVQAIINKYEALDAVGFAKVRHNALFPYDKRETAPEPGDEKYGYWNYETFVDSTNTNWLKEVTQLAQTKNYNVSMSGGNDKGNFLASFGYVNNEGIIKKTDFNRFTTNLKANGNPTDWLNLAFNSRFSSTESNGTVTINSDASAGSAGILQQVLTTSPIRSPEIDFIEEEDSAGGDDGVVGNPLSTLQNVDQLRENISITSNFAATVSLWPGIKFKSSLGLMKKINDYYFFAPSTTSWGAQSNGKSRIRNSKTDSWVNENTLSINKVYRKHRLNFLLGNSNQKTKRFRTTIEATNFPIETLGYNNIAVGEGVFPAQSYADDFFLKSFFARVNYNFKGKYLFTASYRADGSSKFSKDNKWGYFPSFALAWKLDKETFIQDLNIFNQFKFRIGWGQTGNPNIPPYQSLTNYGITTYPSGNNISTGVFPINVGNPKLKWEISEQANIGLDISILNSRLSLTVDAYIKDTKDLLLEGEIPPSLGFGNYLYNSGQLTNKGLEFSLNSLIIDTKVKWSASFNIAFNKNEVVDLGELTANSQVTVPGTKNYATAVLEEGNSVGLWYGYQTDGLWQQDQFTWNGSSYSLTPNAEGELPAALAGAKPGYWKFKDISGPNGVPDGIINSLDKTVIGNSQPKFTGGFSTSLKYKNLDFSLLLEGSYGRDVYNANYLQLVERAGSGRNSLNVDYWLPIQYGLNDDGTEDREIILDPGNPSGKYPGAGLGNAFADTHDAYIEDGSYLRVKSITIGYTFQSNIFKGEVNSFRIYSNIQNAFTLTNYSGYDPNVNGQTLGGLRPGYDFGSYPLSAIFTVGLNVNF